LEFFGYSEAELLKLDFQAVTHPDDLASDLNQVENLLAGRGQTYQMNKRYRRADGRVVWGHLTVSLVKNAVGQPLHFISQIEDITARKQLEEELTTARDDALAAVRSKSEFLATMSHEIRTPMNGILGSMDLLRESTLDGDQRELVELVHTSAEALMRVLNDILDFSKIEQGKLSITPTAADLAYLVRETAELFAAQAEQKGLQLTVELAPTLSGDFWIDGDRFRQVLNNLISNALKFTEAGQVTVQAEPAPARAEPASAQWFRFRVRDTGIGIPPEAQSRLFQSFTQVDGSTSRRFGGTGLGLAIAKRLVELLGGQIGLHSSPGQGTEVWFDLPLARVPAGLDGEIVPPTIPGPQTGQILVAEDNPINQAVIRRILERMGYAVHLVDHGGAALAALASRKFDALILDCQMPQLDGYDTARRVRSGDAGMNPGIPIIALSAHVMPADQAKCFAAGMDDALPKPVERADLGAALQRAGRATGFDRELAAREASFRRSTIVLDPAVVTSLRERPGTRGPSLWPEFAAEYLAFETQQTDAIETAAAAKQDRRLAEAAHVLADRSAALGAAELTGCASALETAARTGRWEDAARLLKVLRQARARLGSALRLAFPPAA
jgi:PAS domain S-box-containing protein